jgi:hypothetical protein
MKRILFFSFSLLFFISLPFTVFAAGVVSSTNKSDLKVSVFDIDATPQIGYNLAYGTMVNSYDLGLRAKGMVLLGSGLPIVLVSIDWTGITNECEDEFRNSLAEAAGTVPERVAVHVVHQHDAPYANDIHDGFVLSVIERLKIAVKGSLDKTVPVTHIGLGEAPVYKIASTRRPLGADGKVKASRYSFCLDSSLRAEPEGLIDPILSTVSFWNNDKPVVILNYYASHPQSYYRTGVANPDFPGIARFYRQLEVPDALNIYFTGAGANVGAGKYNDGSHGNRGVLAGRLADGMKRAWENTKRFPVTASDVYWTVDKVSLPLDSARSSQSTLWQRYKDGRKFDVQCLALNKARILFMPGELFVEYQLAAKKMRPDLFVAMAAYGDLGPGYIPTDKAFTQGGYEESAANVKPGVEAVLMNAISKLLNAGK